LNTLVNFQSAQPSKTGQFSFGINTTKYRFGGMAKILRHTKEYGD